MDTIVDDLMTTKSVTVKEEDTLQRAIEHMDKNHIKCFIIADTDNHAKGIISRADLIRLFAMKRWGDALPGSVSSEQAWSNIFDTH